VPRSQFARQRFLVRPARNGDRLETELRSNTGGWVACEIGILMIRDAEIAAASGHATYNVL